MGQVLFLVEIEAIRFSQQHGCYASDKNGKIEQWHHSLQRECIRSKTPTNLEEAREIDGSKLFNTLIRAICALRCEAPSKRRQPFPIAQ